MPYNVKVQWTKSPDESFTDNRYSRGHRLIFDGLEIAGSSSPHVVPTPMSVAAAVDPEEAFVASLASCHMLWFLSIAAGRGLVVASYVDDAEGMLGKGADGNLGMTVVRLRPAVEFESDVPVTVDEIAELHHLAHAKCFIANSVKTDVRIEPK